MNIHSTANIHLDAACAVVRRHCDHGDGRVSMSLVPPTGQVIDVYIVGTPDELMNLASAFVVQAHLLVKEREAQP